jgi:hypothetical protein
MEYDDQSPKRSKKRKSNNRLSKTSGEDADDLSPGRANTKFSNEIKHNQVLMEDNADTYLPIDKVNKNEEIDNLETANKNNNLIS